MNKAQLQTKFDSPQASPGFLLWQTSNKWQAQQRKALVAFDLTHVQFVLLASLVWATGKAGFTQRQLATYAQTDVMMTSQVVRKLVQKGLLTRTPGKPDSRSFTLRPTPEGIELAIRAIKTVESVDNNFFAALAGSLPDFIMKLQVLANQDSSLTHIIAIKKAAP